MATLNCTSTTINQPRAEVESTYDRALDIKGFFNKVSKTEFYPRLTVQCKSHESISFSLEGWASLVTVRDNRVSIKMTAWSPTVLKEMESLIVECF